MRAVMQDVAPRPMALAMAVALLVALAVLPATPARAQQNNFDLAGPSLTVTVTRGERTLPIAQVPAIQPGDRLALKADLPPDQSARYLLVLAFLRGATNPPPKNWFHRAETWNRRKSTLEIVVPQGAGQAIAFLAPETGGGFDAVQDAVRGRPGVFVRAAQDLHQASLDRARLEAFVAGIARVEEQAPERLRPVSTALAATLAIRLDAECLSRPRAAQAACLTQSRDGMVLQTGRSSTLAEQLSGTPTALAYSLSATREGGAGFYSPYIGLARDVARLFGAFRTASYQYAPALAVASGATLRLQLNAAPSFQNPRSVLVAPLPPVDAAPPPVLRAAAKEALCLVRPGLVLPLEDAPLVFATDYARALTLRLRTADARTVDVPLTADAERGGLVLPREVQGIGSAAIAEATLHGQWGFDGFTGPRFALRNGTPADWTPSPDNAVVVGRDTPLTLHGGAPACVRQIGLRERGGEAKPVEWKASGADAIVATLPLARTRPGDLTLVVTQFGDAPPAQLALRAQSEASRLEGFALYTGEREGRLPGARLDQVARLEIGGLGFVPAALTRGDAGGDRLTLTAEGDTAALPQGSSEAKVTLRDGRSVAVRATVTPPRPRVELVSRNVAPAAATAAGAAAGAGGGLPLTLPAAVVPADARLTFSVRAANTRLNAADTIEIATGDESARAKLTTATGALQLLGGDVAVATLVPRQALGAAAVGALRMRLVQGDMIGEWQPLARVVRLPALAALSCPAGDAGGAGACTLSGDGLYLIAAVAPDAAFATPQPVPAGFVGHRLEVPRPIDGTLYLRLNDAPDEVVRLTPPPGR